MFVKHQQGKINLKLNSDLSIQDCETEWQNINYIKADIL